MFSRVRFSNLLKASVLSCSALMLLSGVCYGQGQQPPTTVLISAPIRNNSTNSMFVGGQEPDVSGDSNTISYTLSNNPIPGSSGLFPAVARDRRGVTDGGAFISLSQIDGTPSEARATSINRTGNVIAFQSSEFDIVNGAPVAIGQRNIYLNDRNTGINGNILVSRPLNPPTPPNGDSTSPAINADGTLVVFVSTATNISQQSMNQPPGTQNIFLFNRSTQSIDLISKDAQGNLFTSDCSSPAISDDGSVIVFASRGQIFIKRTGDAGAQPISTIGIGILPTVSGDGNAIAYLTNQGSDVVIVQISGNSMLRFFVNSVVPSQLNRPSRPALSRNGRFLAVTSTRALITDDKNGSADIYVFDLNLGPAQTPNIVSIKDDGTFAFGDSFDPVVSDDADVVAFSTIGDRLTVDLAPGVSNIYARINLLGGGALGGGVGVLNLGPICIAAGRAIAPDAIEISWGFPGIHNEQLKGFKVEVNRFEGGNYKVINTVPADGKAIFTDTGLKPNTKYDYRIWVIDQRGFAYARDFSAKTKKVKKH